MVVYDISDGTTITQGKDTTSLIEYVNNEGTGSITTYKIQKNWLLTVIQIPTDLRSLIRK